MCKGYIFDSSLKLFLLVALIILFVPFSPKMPALGLDPSWALGLNEAVAQGLAFGKEILFTLGPYSSIYTKAYHPATDGMMVDGSLYLALSYWICLIVLMKNLHWLRILVLLVLFLGLIHSRDSLFFSYPLLVALACYKQSNTSQSPFLWIALVAPFGLLPLIKGSLLILCAAIISFCFLFFLSSNRKKESLICLITPFISMMFFWTISGQSLLNLPSFIVNSYSIAAGFTEAMANNGNQSEVIFYLIASVLILLFLACQKQLPTKQKLFLLSVFCSFLLLSFKTAFTRHIGHAFIAGTSILIAPVFLLLVFQSRALIALILFSLYTATFINGHYMKVSIPRYVASTYSVAWHGLTNRIKDKNWLKDDFLLCNKFLYEQTPFPKLQGTTDIYSYGQTYLLANHLTWDPRPIFQSYSVFTSKLAEINQKHLLGAKSPENIIFRIEPIDGRIPSIEDGASWPLLLANYQPKGMFKDFLLLEKKTVQEQVTNPFKPLSSEKQTLGEVVLLPKLNVIPEKADLRLLFVKIDIKPTLWGRLAILFFKPSQLQATVELKNGVQKHYRFSVNMAESGFLLSPFIENTKEFALLYTRNNALENKEVKSFRIQPLNQNWQWSQDYVVHWELIKVLPPIAQ